MESSDSPPSSGHAARYEILHRNEMHLQSLHQDLLTNNNGNDQEEHEKIRHLHTQTLFHRTSLQCLLQSCAEVARRGGREEEVTALSALWDSHHGRLEEEMCLPNCIGREQCSSDVVSGPTDGDVLDAPDDLADRFFEMFPEVARCEDDLVYSSSDESSVVEEVKAKKKKGDKEEPIVVSGEDSPTHAGGNNATDNNGKLNAFRKNQNGNAAHPLDSHSWQQNRHMDNNQARSLNNHQPHSNYQQQSRQFNNPYNQIQNRPQHQQQHGHNQYQRPSTGCFDYNESNENQPIKENPFRTAREVQGKLDNNDNWDEYEGRNNSYNNKNGRNNRNGGWNNEEESYRGNSNMNNNRANNSSRPQQLVQTALKGPNMSKGLGKKFQCPKSSNSNNGGQTNKPQPSNNSNNDNDELPEELKDCSKDLIERIENDIVDSGEKISFEDIAGLNHAKSTVDEMIIMPMRNPAMFTGLREAPKGLLLFGPPGTGKTLIAKAIANSSGATFFSISSSSLTSKWIGEGEQLVRTLYAVARYRAPSVVFIDEIDSMLTERKSDENEASRRMKTEFLVRLDGAGNEKKAHVLTIGATNRPQELDDAVRRRFVKRLYVPLPEVKDRETLIRRLLSKNTHSITDSEFSWLAKKSDGYSGADLNNFCKEAAMYSLRQLTSQIGVEAAMTAKAEDLPPISFKHCRRALNAMSPSVAPADLKVYVEWNDLYGTKAFSQTLDDDTESDPEFSDDE